MIRCVSHTTAIAGAPATAAELPIESPLLANVAVPPLTNQGVYGRRCSLRSAGAARSGGAVWTASGGQQTHGDVQRQAVQVHGEPQEGRERRTRGVSHGRPRPLRRCLSHVRTRGADSSARARHQGEPAPVPGEPRPWLLLCAGGPRQRRAWVPRQLALCGPAVCTHS